MCNSMIKFSNNEKIDDAVKLAFRYGGIDGSHHKQWLINKILETLLTEDEYSNFIKIFNSDEDGENMYEWDEGVAP